RSGKGADRGVVGEHRLDDVTLEPGREIVVGALRHQIDNTIELAADAAVAPEQRRGLLEAAPIASRRIDRSFKKKSPNNLGRLFEIRVELRVYLSIVTREASELPLRFIRIVTVDEVVVAIERAEEIVRRQYFKPELRQLQLGNNARMK